MLIDFTSQAQYLWAMLPEVVLACWAMFVLMVDVFQRGDRQEPSSPAIAWITLAGIGLAMLANLWLLGLTELGKTGMIAIDPFRVFANSVFLLAGALFILISGRYLVQERIRLGELYVLVLLALVGMMVFAGARDLIVIFIGLELMSLPIYILVGVNRRDRRSAEAALKYFLLGAFSSAFFLFGIALIYGGAGTVNIGSLALLLTSDGLGSNPLILTGMVLLVVGFAFKVAAVPFHMWAPDAYTGAPAPVAAFMATAVKAAGFTAFVRVFFTAFPGLYETWGVLVFWLAVLSMVTANLIALVQNNVKRMLAYSSIAHAGYLLVAIAAANVLGAGAVLFYLVAYTFMTAGAFAVVLLVARTSEERLDISAYSGLALKHPLLAVAMTVFLLSLAGFPLTGGFIGKVYILLAALESGLLSLAILLVLASLVSYWYYLRVAWYMWFREADGEHSFEGIAISPSMRVALVGAVAGVLGLFLFGSVFIGVAEQSAAALVGATGNLPVAGLP